MRARVSSLSFILLTACPPTEEATSTSLDPATSEAADASTAATPTSGAPTTATSSTPSSSGATGSTSTGDDSDATSAGTPSTGDASATGDTSDTSDTGDTTTGDTTTGVDADPHACPELWTGPAACTSPACRSVTRRWMLRDAAAPLSDGPQHRFAADGSVLATLYGGDPGWSVVHVAPDDEVTTLHTEENVLAAIDLNPTAVNFSIFEPVEGSTSIHLYDAEGIEYAALAQQFCDRHLLVPDSLWTFRVKATYLNENDGCEITALGFLDESGINASTWVPEARAQDFQVGSAGVYYTVVPKLGVYNLVHHDIAGQVPWAYPGEAYSFAVAPLADRMVVQFKQIFHLHGGAPLAGFDVSGRERISPSGGHSAAGTGFNNIHALHHFTDGALDWSIPGDFTWLKDLAVSEVGEVAVIGGIGDDRVVLLYDVTGALMWRADIGPIVNHASLALSLDGQALTVREDGCLSRFDIVR